LRKNLAIIPRSVLVLCVQLVAAHFLCAQKLEIVTSQAADSQSKSLSPEIFLLVILALVAGAVGAWLLRGKVKVSEEAAYQSYKPPKPQHLNRRKPKKKEVLLDESAERKRMLSSLNQVVESTKEDIRYLPLFSFRSIPDPPAREPLPELDDPQLLAAIENSNEEMQPDPEVREAAIGFLSRFRTAASIDALSQVAIYDLSSSLRSSALATLASFDHGSVFEPILLACADPTREVRAAASRALSKLTFARSDEWFRIADADDTFSVRQCARAAVAAGLHTATFGRLVNRERNAVLEAFAIVCVLIRAGETDDLIDAIMSHADVNVSSALLHIIQLTRDEALIRELATAVDTFEIRPEIRPQIQQIISGQELSNVEGAEAGFAPENLPAEIAQIRTGV